jgi:acyl carrier protein
VGKKMKDKIFDSVVAAIAKQKHIERDIILEKSSLVELGMTSLDAITIVYEIEEEFGIEVPGDVLESFETVKDIVECISGLITK